MLNYLLLMSVPLTIAFVTLFIFKKRVTLAEFFGQVILVAALVGFGFLFAYNSRTSDYEIWNGKVVSKERREIHCQHSYDCNCYYTEECSGYGKEESCTMVRHCMTCYEHDYDVSWYVFASTNGVSVNESVEIDTVDRQGLVMPPRWGAAFVGEPWASGHTYTNYILANPDSVLLGGKGDVEKFGKFIPQYPKVYDYYKVNHVVNMGVPDLNAQVWEWLIREVNKTLGPQKQVNLLLVFVPLDDPRYSLAFKDVWVGGKKNDVDIIIGSKDGHKIEFVSIVSWTPNAGYKVDLGDEILRIGTLDDRDGIVKAIDQITSSRFQRMHMQDFKYLLRSFQPSNTFMWVMFVISSLVSVGMAVFNVMNDIEDDDVFWKRHGYSSLSHWVVGKITRWRKAI